MGWIQLAIAVVRLIGESLKLITEHKSEKRKKRMKVIHEGTKAVRERDAVGFNRAVNGLRNL